MPPWPIVTEAFPDVKYVWDVLYAQPVRKLHVLIEERVLIPDGEHEVVAAQAVKEPGVFETGEIIKRRMQVRILVVIAVEEALGDIESAGHAHGVSHEIGMAEREVDGVVSAEAAAGGGHLRPTGSIADEGSGFE